MIKATKDQVNRAQRIRFIEAARELGCDEGEAHFKDALRNITRVKVPPSKRKKPKREKT